MEDSRVPGVSSTRTSHGTETTDVSGPRNKHGTCVCTWAGLLRPFEPGSLLIGKERRDSRRRMNTC